MRITNAMMTGSYLKNLNMNLTSVDKYQTQVTTGKRITRISDDPVGRAYQFANQSPDKSY